MSGLEQIHAALSGGWLLAALAALGLVTGVLSGLFGVGGAFLLNPLMIAVLGIDESLAVGSGLGLALGTGAAGVRRHLRGRNVEPRSMAAIGLTAVAGTALGAELHEWLRRLAGPAGFQPLVLALYAALLLGVAWLVYRDRPQRGGARSLLQRLPLPPRIDLPEASLRGVSLPGLAGVGLLVGICTGLLGVGGGVLYMPLLLLAVGLTAHQAVGTSLGVVLFSSAWGTAHHALRGNVSLWITMSLLAGSTTGVQVGAFLCERLHARRLRRFFAGVLLLTVVVVAVKLVLLLWPPRS